MQMVSAARFRQMHRHARAGRAYAHSLADVVADILRRSGEGLAHPLLRESAGTQEALLVITSDRGLCGAFNLAVLRLGMERLGQLLRTGHRVSVRVLGKRGLRYFRHRGFAVEELAAELPTRGGRGPAYDDVAALADRLMREYLRGDIAGLEVAYVQFLSAGRQEAAISQILPLTQFTEAEETVAVTTAEPVEYEFSPSAGELLDDLLPKTVRLLLYRCFMDAAVSEHAMRIRAMRAATDNADEMIRELTGRLNRVRQSQITKELTEITGGGAAGGRGPDVAWALRRKLLEKRRKVEVGVTTPAPLAAPQRAALAAALREALGADVAIDARVDAGLVGGLLVRVGDTVFDASVRGALRRFCDESKTHGGDGGGAAPAMTQT
jgi:F-type H+-transporting ATPase subunit gamma